jgi:YidC/Oxa1 family membrane protein insertase
MDFGFFEIFASVLAWFYALIPSYGLAIILLTLAVRVLLLPLSIKQTRSMREMQVIQPEIKRLQKKYKGDRQKMNQEVMALYKEHGVNPLGGCAPLLLQMPVFIALFYVVRQPIQYLGESVLKSDLMTHALSVHQFLGLRLDCSPQQVFAGENSAVRGITEGCTSGGILPFLPYLFLILFMGATTYYQQKQMQASRGSSGDPQQQQMQTFMKIMPVILIVFGFGFPTGVVIYWVTTNLWTIVQQRIMLKAAPPITATKAMTAKAKAKEGRGSATKASSSKTTAAKDGSGKKRSQGTPGRPPKKSPAKTTPSSGGNPSPHSSKKKKRK